MAMTKVKNLQLWCKRMSDGYRDVEVTNMAAAWKSGLAFCAIIHRFRPDLIDYESLSKENVFDNNQLAFEVAEQELSIPAFLEAADMVAIRVPDKLSVVTYVSQYYNYFHDKPQLGGPGVNKFVSKGKKKKDSTPDKPSLSQANKNGTDIKMKDRQESMGDKCSMCHEKVYLLERHLENNRLYHRSCHRKSDQSPTSKVFKRQQHGPSELETLGTSKLRKLDEPGPESGDKGAKLDFWQRRAQAKAKDSPVVTSADKSSDTKNVQDRTSTNLTSWSNQKDDKRESAFLKKSKDTDNGDRFEKPGMIQTSGAATKPSNIVNRFKELDERNKKQLANSSSSKSESKNSSGLSVPNQRTTQSPVPKPRQAKFEKMDVDISEPYPKPVPRNVNTKEKNVSPKASPRQDEHKKHSPALKTKHDFSRPKTPPSARKSNFTVTLSQNVSQPSPPGSPPPLPPGSPPKLPQSEPPKITTSIEPRKIEFKSNVISKKTESNNSPKASPRNKTPHKDTFPSAFTSTAKTTVAPAKPQRTSVTERSGIPMDTSEAITPAKAVVHEPAIEHKAVLVTPKRGNDEKKNKEVFGGLLKSLAQVRTKHDHDTKPSDPDSGDVNKSASRFSASAIMQQTVAEKGNHKSEQSEKKDTKFKVPPRPKSSFISQSASKFSEPAHSKESHVKTDITTKTTTTTVVTNVDKNKVKKTETVTETVTKSSNRPESDIPEWKRELEKNKMNKPRPKSADLLGEKTSGKTEWQIEAENRKNARNGAYVDPEKAKIDVKSKFTNSDIKENVKDKSQNGLSRPVSPPKQRADVPPTKTRILPEKPDLSKKTEKEIDTAQKKKIGLSEKFVFEDIEVGSKPKKPPRLEINTGGISGPKSTPARPPPPSPSAALSGHVKNHLSAFQIQRQLQLIDEKLTKLELKGRQLEDQIRTAEESTEDELMINWFKLVNEKNELVRTECDYVYISRQQELEIEQQNIEARLRHLVEKQDSLKTDIDRQDEEELMLKKVDIVNQRNNIVDSIDEDRIRYLEEDKDIEYMLQQKGFLKDDKTGGVKKKDHKKEKKEKK